MATETADMTITNYTNTDIDLKVGIGGDSDCVTISPGNITVPKMSSNAPGSQIEKITFYMDCESSTKYAVIDFWTSGTNSQHLGGYRYEVDSKGLYVYQHPFEDCWYYTPFTFNTTPASSADFPWNSFPYQLSIDITGDFEGSLVPDLFWCPRY
jgi:hypothetical protein